MAHDKQAKPDFSPLIEGSADYNMAVKARREMLSWIGKAPEPEEVVIRGNVDVSQRFRWPTFGDLKLGVWASKH